MKAYQINNNQKFTEALFETELFDGYEMTEANVRTVISYHINGSLSPSEDYIRFSKVRPTLFDIISRDETLSSMKLVLFHRSSDTSVISGGFINITLSDDTIMLTSAVSYNSFSTDRSFEDAWDAYISKLLASHDLI